MPFLAAPVIVYLCTHTRMSRIHYVWVGWLLGVVALIGAAFSPSIPTLIVTQGLLYGISILLADNPLLLIVNTWFLSRRGIAYGTIFAFSGEWFCILVTGSLRFLSTITSPTALE